LLLHDVIEGKPLVLKCQVGLAAPGILKLHHACAVVHGQTLQRCFAGSRRTGESYDQAERIKLVDSPLYGSEGTGA
jgi:hypothetical protein